MSDAARDRRWRLQLLSGILFVFAGATFAVVAILSAAWGLGVPLPEVITMMILGAVGAVMIRAALRLRRSR